MRFLICGANGQLGREFCKVLEMQGYTVLATDYDTLDVSRFNEIENYIKDFRPDTIINCSAYNLVDKAEEDWYSTYKINSLAVANLASACNKYNIKLVHYGTDYSFDGTKKEKYTEEDKVNPICQYAKSKVLGEEYATEFHDNVLIFRVSWIYGEGNQNFIQKLLSWTEQNDVLKIADDEISIPTSCSTIVNVTLKALERDLRGMYHLTNSGIASRYEWAKEVLSLMGIEKQIESVSKDIFNLPAKRPGFSALSNEKISKELGIEIEDWKYALKEYIERSNITV